MPEQTPLSKLLDSNAMWGGIGLILGGIGASLGTTYLVLVGWVVLSFAFLRARFFSESYWPVRILGNIVAVVMIGAGLILLLMFLPKPQQPENLEATLAKFVQQVRSSPSPTPITAQVTSTPGVAISETRQSTTIPKVIKGTATLAMNKGAKVTVYS